MLKFRSKVNLKLVQLFNFTSSLLKPVIQANNRLMYQADLSDARLAASAKLFEEKGTVGRYSICSRQEFKCYCVPLQTSRVNHGLSFFSRSISQVSRFCQQHIAELLTRNIRTPDKVRLLIGTARRLLLMSSSSFLGFEQDTNGYQF